MTPLGKDWFVEVGQSLWPGRALALQIKEVLYEGRSQFQEIRVFDSVGAGRVLTLDGIIQLTESDEFAYQEMLTHVPLFAHPDPKSVLVIGGGDGGILREVAKHRGVERMDICEIDGAVIDVSRRHLPFTACGFDDPRVKIYLEDGAVFVARAKAQYDVIIVDSSDPIGPAEVLYREPFYRAMREALKPGGIITTQAESAWLHRNLVRSLMEMARAIFDTAHYAYTCVPTYPSGQIGLLAASRGPEVRTPLREPDQATRAKLRYYTPEVHRASFILPAFAHEFAC